MQRILLAGAMCFAVIATPASAQIAGGYNDRQHYDFGRANDVSYDARVKLAARQWCGERMGRVPIREYLQVRACKRDFIERARSGEDPTHEG